MHRSAPALLLMLFLITFLPASNAYADLAIRRLEGRVYAPMQVCRDGIEFAYGFQGQQAGAFDETFGMFLQADPYTPEDLPPTSFARNRGVFHGYAVAQPLATALPYFPYDSFNNQFGTGAFDADVSQIVIGARRAWIRPLEPGSLVVTTWGLSVVGGPFGFSYGPPDSVVFGEFVRDAARTSDVIGDCYLFTAPDILRQPQSTLVVSGQRARLTVLASVNGAARYQWYEGAQNDISRPVRGATGSLLQTPPVQNATRFWVRVSSASGTVDSAAAAVNLVQFPRFLPLIGRPGRATTSLPSALLASNAGALYGQPDFSSGIARRGAIDAHSFEAPSGVAIDANGGAYVVDSANHRVLYYPSGASVASRVYGQANFSTNTANRDQRGLPNQPSATSLFVPVAVALGNDGVYIADSYNHRVLFFPGETTTASRVYGQPNFTTRTLRPAAATSLQRPGGVVVAPDGVYIADSANHRVLFFAGTSTTASRVYGQPDLNSNAELEPSATTLRSPLGLAVTDEGLYVADRDHGRVLFFAGASTTATRVFGQTDFTTSQDFFLETSADRLRYPTDVAVMGSNLYVADGGNHRVLRFAATTSASSALAVYGQASFTDSSSNRGGAAGADTLALPYGLAANAQGLYVADLKNHRVLSFPPEATLASRVYAQTSFDTGQPLRQQVSARSLDNPQGVAVADDGGVYVADTSSSRVLYYPPGSTTASRVYGQPDLSSHSPNRGLFTVAADTLAIPGGLALAEDGLYVADTGNHRVLFFPDDATTATRVYGQAALADEAFPNRFLDDPQADTLASPTAVAVGHGGIYIADAGNNRVLFFPDNATTATRVYGQPSFNSSLPNRVGSVIGGPTAENLFMPTGLTLATDGLYVADSYNHRVLYYPGTSTTATRVYGQPNLTSGVANNSGDGTTRAPRATNLLLPLGVTLSPQGLWIADSGNHRLLFYPTTTTTATKILGQSNLGAGVPNNNGNGGLGPPSAASLHSPVGLAFAQGQLYVADRHNHRVLVYALP